MKLNAQQLRFMLWLGNGNLAKGLDIYRSKL